jgi:hypothetical protein
MAPGSKCAKAIWSTAMVVCSYTGSNYAVQITAPSANNGSTTSNGTS